MLLIIRGNLKVTLSKSAMEFTDNFNYWIVQQDVKPALKLIYKKKQCRGGRAKKQAINFMGILVMP